MWFQLLWVYLNHIFYNKEIYELWQFRSKQSILYHNLYKYLDLFCIVGLQMVFLVYWINLTRISFTTKSFKNSVFIIIFILASTNSDQKCFAVEDVNVNDIRFWQTHLFIIFDNLLYNFFHIFQLLIFYWFLFTLCIFFHISILVFFFSW